MLRIYLIGFLLALWSPLGAQAQSALSLLVEHELAAQDKEAKNGKFTAATKEKYRALYAKKQKPEYLFLYLRLLDASDGMKRFELSDKLLKEKNFPYAFWAAALVMKDEGRLADAYKYWQRACAEGLELPCEEGESLAEEVCKQENKASECAKIGAYEFEQKRLPLARKYLEAACTNNSSTGCHTRGMIEFEYGDLVETKIWMDKACALSKKKGCDLAKRIQTSLLETSDMQDSLDEFERGCARGKQMSCNEADRLRKALREPAAAR